MNFSYFLAYFDRFLICFGAFRVHFLADFGSRRSCSGAAEHGGGRGEGGPHGHGSEAAAHARGADEVEE